MIPKTIDLAGETLHYADFGGEGPTLVLVHGLGGSYSTWLAVGTSLARRGRVVAPDLPGFGRSPSWSALQRDGNWLGVGWVICERPQGAGAPGSRRSA